MWHFLQFLLVKIFNAYTNKTLNPWFYKYGCGNVDILSNKHVNEQIKGICKIPKDGR